MSLSELTERLYNLRRDRSSGYEKPYKPALLLSLIDLIERGDFPDNRIQLTDDLIKRYREYIRVVGGTDDAARIQYPFWHLCGDGLWAIYGTGGRELYRSGKTASRSPSVKRLREEMDHAAMDAELFHALCVPGDRVRLRWGLIARYFPEQRHLLNASRREFLNQPAGAVEDAESYESDPARSGAFAKFIKRLYDYRCAACGIRVRFRDLTLVEACHLIPFSRSFNDHPTNGISLCKNHHWALDRNLIAPSVAAKGLLWQVSPLLDDRLDDHRPLLELNGKQVLVPDERKFHPAPKSVEWSSSKLLR